MSSRANVVENKTNPPQFKNLKKKISNPNNKRFFNKKALLLKRKDSALFVVNLDILLINIIIDTKSQFKKEIKILPKSI